jgi:antitoxin HicB
MSHVYKLPLRLEPQPEGGYTVTSPVLSALITEGETIEETLTNVRDALQALLESYEDAGCRCLGGSARARANSVSTSNLPSVCHDRPGGSPHAPTAGLRGSAAPLRRLAPDLAHPIHRQLGHVA